MLEETKAKEMKEAEARTVSHMTKEERGWYLNMQALLRQIAFAAGSPK